MSAAGYLCDPQDGEALWTSQGAVCDRPFPDPVAGRLWRHASRPWLHLLGGRVKHSSTVYCILSCTLTGNRD